MKNSKLSEIFASIRKIPKRIRESLEFEEKICNFLRGIYGDMFIFSRHEIYKKCLELYMNYYTTVPFPYPGDEYVYTNIKDIIVSGKFEEAEYYKEFERRLEFLKIQHEYIICRNF